MPCLSIDTLAGDTAHVYVGNKDDKKCFLVHKQLLSRRSPYFQRAFNNEDESIPSHTGVIEFLNDVDVPSFTQFVNFLYRDNIFETEPDDPSIESALRKFMLDAFTADATIEHFEKNIHEWPSELVKDASVIWMKSSRKSEEPRAVVVQAPTFKKRARIAVDEDLSLSAGDSEGPYAIKGAPTGKSFVTIFVALGTCSAIVLKYCLILGYGFASQ
ncbi:hypothetical protein EJ08DRAFT_664123 [Tothia fuscella]|uniref:BTB domain-containing protein n=1 Tax=Tothia fuscella TaxID=1048955 RepID=A0A9P4TVD9_9PEZI|nr:hypothetical protein EJ08DRAFT_664123 [Tothia fuscella]